MLHFSSTRFGDLKFPGGWWCSYWSVRGCKMV